MSDRCINGYFLRVSEEGVPYRGYMKEFEDSLDVLQEYEGGYIEVVALDCGIDIIINDEGKIKELPVNRAWTDGNGRIYDVIHGNILCVRHDGEGEFISIEKEDIPIIEKALIPLILLKGHPFDIKVLIDSAALPVYKKG
ncbi:MAG: DUF3846 domain-containing protein [Lachnospiraceae bacterium]|nr:DUF3846 domain-containing protein [Lachnospiraceae bacterium]